MAKPGQDDRWAGDWVTYTPASALRRPRGLVRAMVEDLGRSRGLAWRLLVRDLSSQYRRSLLGVFWAFIPPMVTALGLTLAKNSQVLNIGETDIPYPAYVMFSMALWQTFVEATNRPMQSVIEAKPMLAKINFPREALILAGLGQVCFNFAVKLILILGLFWWFDISASGRAVLAVVPLIHLILLGTGVGLLLTPIGALYEDVSRGLTLIMAVWLFLTPVIFPTPTTGLFATLVRLNPVTPLLVTVRELTIAPGMVSNPLGFGWASGLALVLVLVGWLVYRITMPFVIERMSA